MYLIIASVIYIFFWLFLLLIYVINIILLQCIYFTVFMDLFIKMLRFILLFDCASMILFPVCFLHLLNCCFVLITSFYVFIHGNVGLSMSSTMRASLSRQYVFLLNNLFFFLIFIIGDTSIKKKGLGLGCFSLYSEFVHVIADVFITDRHFRDNNNNNNDLSPPFAGQQQQRRPVARPLDFSELRTL